MSNVGKRGKVSLLGRLTTAKQRGTSTTLRAHEVGRVLDALRPAAPQPDHGVGETLVADFEAAVMNYWPVDKGLSASELGCRIDRLNETRNAILAALKASEKGNG